MINDISFILLYFRYIWRDSILDTKEEKRWTWILVIFSLWPQYQALKLLKRIFTLKRSGVYKDNEDLKRHTTVLVITPV